jgi:hypothetical protein
LYLFIRKDVMQMSNNYYPPYQQYSQPRQFQVPAYQVQPVGSREEAIAVPVDYFSLGTIMPVPGQGVMFFKRFNQQTGQSDFVEFVARQPAPPVQYATKEDVEELRKMIGGMRDA